MQRVGKAKGETSPVTLGLLEQDSAQDPTARSSHEPELPVAEDSGSDPDDLPELSESEGDGLPSTLDYGSHRGEDADPDSDEEWDMHSHFEELMADEELVRAAEEDAVAGVVVGLQASLNEHGTKATHGPTEVLDGEVGAE